MTATEQLILNKLDSILLKTERTELPLKDFAKRVGYQQKAILHLYNEGLLTNWSISATKKFSLTEWYKKLGTPHLKQQLVESMERFNQKERGRQLKAA